MSPPNIAGVMDTNPITMTKYSVDWESQTGLKDIFWLPGVGDHGGGPTRDMLETGKRYQRSPFFPKLHFTTAQEYLDKISVISPQNFPVWNSELYLELHRGCYTTHGEQKYFNRYSEKLLYQAELFSTIAIILAQKFDLHFDIYSNNQEKIKQIWQKLLLNQFHDILPGTSIPSVFTEIHQIWQEIIKDAQQILQESLKAIASYINFENVKEKESQIIVIFNALNWQRSETVEVEIKGDNYSHSTSLMMLDSPQLPLVKEEFSFGEIIEETRPPYSIFDGEGNQLKTQISHEGKLLFLAENIPSIGYKSFYIIPHKNLKRGLNSLHEKLLTKKALSENDHIIPEFILENKYLQVVVDKNTGNLISVYDKINNQEVLNGYGNELQLFEDKGQYWDAWNIDPNYEQHRLENPTLTSIQWLEKGKLRQIIRIEKTFNRSQFIQDYILNFNSPIVIIKNQIHWQEDYTLLKVNFSLNIESDFVTYDIACGNIQRTTKPKTKAEKAQWEVYGHHWADLTNKNYGVSLLNDCKYGYDSKPNQLRLTLLRSPKWPDEKCDQGYHEFSYSLYPHKNNWKKANTVRKGYEFNTPLQVLFLGNNQSQLSVLPSTAELIKIEAENLILMALKLTEDNSNNVLLRGYECHGESVDLSLKRLLDLPLKTRVNLLEDKINNQDLLIKPYQIFSFIF